MPNAAPHRLWQPVWPRSVLAELIGEKWPRKLSARAPGPGACSSGGGRLRCPHRPARPTRVGIEGSWQCPMGPRSLPHCPQPRLNRGQHSRDLTRCFLPRAAGTWKQRGTGPRPAPAGRCRQRTLVHAPVCSALVPRSRSPISRCAMRMGAADKGRCDAPQGHLLSLAEDASAPCARRAGSAQHVGCRWRAAWGRCGDV